MDTRLKRYSIWLKVFGVALIIVSTVVIGLVIKDLGEASHEGEFYLSDIYAEYYYETTYYEQMISSTDHELNDAYYFYNTDPKTWLSGEYNFYVELKEMFYEATYYQYYDLEVYGTSGNYNISSSDPSFEDDWNEFIIQYDAQIKALANEYYNDEEKRIQEQFSSYENGIVYFATLDDGTVKTNTDCTTGAGFEAAYMTLSDGSNNPSYNNSGSLQFAFTEEYLNTAFIEPFETFMDMNPYNLFSIILACATIIIISLAYLIFAAGKKYKTGIHMMKIDKTYTDFILVIAILGGSVIVISAGALYHAHFNDNNTIPTEIILIPLVLGTVILLAAILSLVRHIKNRTIFKHSMAYKILRRTWRYSKRLLKFIWKYTKKFLKHIKLFLEEFFKFSGKSSKKIVKSAGEQGKKTQAFIKKVNNSKRNMTILIAISGLLVVLGAMLLGLWGIWYGYINVTFVAVCTALASAPVFYIVLRYIKIVDTVSDNVKFIKNGNYTKHNELDFPVAFKELGHDLNDISAGLSDEVERRLKSERMKADLITNVSHDLKTPLTSFITYVDLLKKENIEDEKVRAYIDVLDKKSARLKILVDDLVDSAKASSGNIPVNLEKVDLNALMSQSLGELNDTISASTLDFKLNFPTEKVFVNADGKLLWRVVNNLTSNILKYSMKNSRVYINVFESDDNAFIEFKNISATELNISEDELLERFVQGDASRNTEGSGLGLDIAKSLMKVQDGELSITIDGDLFKATVRIKNFNE